MRTSGHAKGDGLMSVVPLAILVVFVMVLGGGFKSTLRVVELALWAVVDWISALI